MKDSTSHQEGHHYLYSIFHLAEHAEVMARVS